MKFRQLRQVLSGYGISWDERKGKGSHGAFVGLTHISKTKAVYVLPKHHQRETRQPYLNIIRRKFELTKEHGVSDDNFK